MHLIRSHRLKHVQVPEVVTNLIFSYSERDFILPSLILQSIHYSVLKLIRCVYASSRNFPKM